MTCLPPDPAAASAESLGNHKSPEPVSRDGAKFRWHVGQNLYHLRVVSRGAEECGDGVRRLDVLSGGFSKGLESIPMLVAT